MGRLHKVNNDFIELRKIKVTNVSELPLKEFIIKTNNVAEKIMARHLQEIEDLLMQRYPYMAKTNVFQNHQTKIEVIDCKIDNATVLQMWV